MYWCQTGLSPTLQHYPLNTDLILEMSLASGISAECGNVGKHAKNDEMCSELGWTCIPLVVEVYGGWGWEAQEIRMLLKIEQDTCHANGTICHVNEAERMNG